MAKVWRRRLARFGHNRLALTDDCNENKVVYGGRACKPDSPGRIANKQVVPNQQRPFAHDVNCVKRARITGTRWAHRVWMLSGAVGQTHRTFRIALHTVNGNVLESPATASKTVAGACLTRPKIRPSSPKLSIGSALEQPEGNLNLYSYCNIRTAPQFSYPLHIARTAVTVRIARNA